MICPFCKNPETKVTNKRDAQDSIRRRRECLKCGSRFTTFERPEVKKFFVVKKDGRREPYNRDKVLNGLLRACEKRPIPHERIVEIADDIEARLSKRKSEIKTSVIGEFIMKALKKLDKVAYVRFASVYKDFKDIGDFKKEIKSIK